MDTPRPSPRTNRTRRVQGDLAAAVAAAEERSTALRNAELAKSDAERAGAAKLEALERQIAEQARTAPGSGGSASESPKVE